MLQQPNLSQSKQPRDHYDYDGLSGGWLWFPWWVHLILAASFWPVCWWLLPKLPFQNSNITDFLFNYRLKLAIFLSVCTCVTALMSFLKARQIRNKGGRKPQRATVTNRMTKPQASKAKSVTNKLVKLEKLEKKDQVEEGVEKTKEKVVVKSPKISRIKAKPKAEKVEEKPKSKPKAKKSRTKKKKNDSQLQLDF